MKLSLFIIFVFFLIACSKDNDADPLPEPIDTLSTGWKKIQLPTSATVIDIFFINNSTGFAIAGNSIFRSLDGGNNWQKVYESRQPLSNIGMGSAANAIFTPSIPFGSPISSSLTFSTDDGGSGFDSVGLADVDVKDVFFVSESVAYAAGRNTWKTTNGGDSWTMISSFGGPTGGERSLYFLNEQTGWVTGHGLFKTTNAAVTWNNTPASGGLTFGGTGSISFVDNNTGYITDPYSVNKTSNGGISFTKVFSTPDHGYHDIAFVNAQTGYLTDDEHIFKTVDGGQNWMTEVFLKSIRLVEVHFTDASHGWACGELGLILKYGQ